MCYGVFLSLDQSLSQDSEARQGTMAKLSLIAAPSLGAEFSAEKGAQILNSPCLPLEMTY